MILMTSSLRSTDLCEWRRRAFECNGADCLVNFQIENENLARVQQDELMTTRAVVHELQTSGHRFRFIRRTGPKGKIFKELTITSVSFQGGMFSDKKLM